MLYGSLYDLAGSLGFEPRLYGLTVRCTASYARSQCLLVVANIYHLTLFAQYAADIGPLAMFFACRVWNRLRRLA